MPLPPKGTDEQGDICDKAQACAVMRRREGKGGVSAKQGSQVRTQEAGERGGGGGEGEGAKRNLFMVLGFVCFVAHLLQRDQSYDEVAQCKKLPNKTGKKGKARCFDP
jgi:hypothetical protein